MQLRRATGPLAIALALLPLPATGEARLDGASGLAEWSEGPVQWLILHEEWRELRQARKEGRTLEFVRDFWARRDPRPDLARNPLREIFQRRVEAADVLYQEGNLRGSLTDRGRAYILLGSPAHVKVSSRPALAWTSERDPSRRFATRAISVETWGFRLDDLPPGLLEVAGRSQRGSGEALSLTLTFKSDLEHTVLTEGEALLELAASSLLRAPSP